MTNPRDSSVKRLIDALATGKEVCETILNYRRDGTPFINLLMIAPLYDDKGRIRYFIGCQIDVTKLVEGGKGLESMQRSISQQRSGSRFGSLKKSSLESLGELSRQFSPVELEVVRNPDFDHADTGKQEAPRSRPNTARRRLGMEDAIEPERSLWPAGFLGSSGRLPGVYQNARLPPTHATHLQLTNIVHARPSLPISTNHLHFTRDAHTGPRPISLHGPSRRSPTYSRRTARSINARCRCHSQDIMVNTFKA